MGGYSHSETFAQDWTGIVARVAVLQPLSGPACVACSISAACWQSVHLKPLHTKHALFICMQAVSLVGSPVVRRLAEALDGSSIEMLTLRPDSVVAMRRCRLPLLRTLEIDVSFMAATPLTDLATACLRSVAANVQPTPPLLL